MRTRITILLLVASFTLACGGSNGAVDSTEDFSTADGAADVAAQDERGAGDSTEPELLPEDTVTGEVPDLHPDWQCVVADDCLALGEPGTCQLYVCDADHLCRVEGAPDGTPCAPADPCFSSGSCADQECVPETALECDDGNPCTTGSCDPTEGCQYQPAEGPCDDGNACTEEDACVDGLCSGNEVTCDDENPCTEDSCDPLAGCLFEDASGPCDDDDPCTADETCQGGQCVAGTMLCECTEDSDCLGFFDDPCVLEAACNMVALPYVCEAVAVLSCPAPETSCALSYCDAESGTCLLQPTNEGLACDEPVNCVADGTCQEGQCVGEAVVCDDDNDCTADSCEAGLGCQFTPLAAPCDDGDPCTVNDYCNAQGLCAGQDTGCGELPVLGLRLTTLHFEAPGFCLPGPGGCIDATAVVNSFIAEDISGADSPLNMLGLFAPFDLYGDQSTFSLGPGDCEWSGDAPENCQFTLSPTAMAPVAYAPEGECQTSSGASSPAPCFTVTGESIEVGIMNIVIPVTAPEVTGTFDGMPDPGAIVAGNIQAFLPQAVADLVNVTLPLMPPHKLSELLPAESLTTLDGQPGWVLVIQYDAVVVPVALPE